AEFGLRPSIHGPEFFRESWPIHGYFLFMGKSPSVRSGTCHSIFVYDAAFSIDLNEAERRITSFKQREKIRHKRRAPKYFEYSPAPLKVSQEPGVELVLYDFGA